MSRRLQHKPGDRVYGQRTRTLYVILDDDYDVEDGWHVEVIKSRGVGKPRGSQTHVKDHNLYATDDEDGLS